MKNYFKFVLGAMLCSVCFSSCCTIDAILDPCHRPVYVVPAPPPPHHPRPLPPPPPPRHHRHRCSIDEVNKYHPEYYDMASADINAVDNMS